MVDAIEEEVCLQRSRNGDHAAFETLVGAYQRMIYAITYRMTGSMSAAEDLTQETFIRAYQQLQSYRGDAKFATWLGRIAVHLTLNWRTREGQRQDVHQKWAEATLAGTDSGESLDDETSQRIQAALQRLPAAQRAAIVLTLYQNQTHAQAARVLNCTEATVSWRVFAARQKLKRWLKDFA